MLRSSLCPPAPGAQTKSAFGMDLAACFSLKIAPQGLFHHVERSGWVENYIAERLQRLDKFAQGITRCHVTLTREQGKHNKGNRYSVMVEVRLPPQHDLAVKKQKEVRDMATQ